MNEIDEQKAMKRCRIDAELELNKLATMKPNAQPDDPAPGECSWWHLKRSNTSDIDATLSLSLPGTASSTVRVSLLARYNKQVFC